MNASRRSRLCAVALFTALLIASACSSDSGSSQEPSANGDQVDVRLPEFVRDLSSVRLSTGFPPIPFPASDGRTHLSYELYMTNRMNEPVTVTSVKVVDADDPSKVVEDLSGQSLDDRMTLDRTPQIETTTLAPHESGIVYIDASVPSTDDVPSLLQHVVETQKASGEAFAVIEGAFVTPRNMEVPVLGSPVSDGTWVAAEACCFKSHHRRGPFTLGGQDFLAQRYAIDWIKVQDGRLYEGDDPKDLDAWYTFGQDALAVVDGTVSSVLETENDITPLEPNPLPRNIDNITGNHVIIDMGNGLYVVYAHLQKGSIQVKVGDQVKAGDKLALVGNSGNTDAPHLHIHVMDANKVVQSHGIPFVFASFDLLGSYDTIVDLLPELDGRTGPGPFTTLPESKAMTDVYPLELDIVEFNS